MQMGVIETVEGWRVGGGYEEEEEEEEVKERLGLTVQEGQGE